MRLTPSKQFSNKVRGTLAEKRVASLFNGRLQPGSGLLASAHLKADVKSKHFLVDSKLTTKQSFSISSGALLKLRREALQTRRLPVFFVQLGDGTEFAVIPSDAFEDLRNAYIEVNP